jgi:NAD(P)-dependent dehydrogenase (short-subunit alcohol dehydrogenase family)
MSYILLTGSSGVIGKEIKKYLLSKGKHLLELDLLGDPSVDATNEDSVKKFFEMHKEKKIETIINCVGIPDAVPLKAKTILDIDTNYFKKMIDVNLNAVFIIIKECYRLNKDSLKNIINISSLYSVVSPRLDLYNGKIKNPAYTASKHGLIGLTKHLAVILAEDNIRVNCIGPGGVKETINDKDFIVKYNKQVPLKTTIPINEVMKTITYLLSMETITGQNIIVDGGYSLI